MEEARRGKKRAEGGNHGQPDTPIKPKAKVSRKLKAAAAGPHRIRVDPKGKGKPNPIRREWKTSYSQREGHQGTWKIITGSKEDPTITTQRFRKSAYATANLSTKGCFFTGRGYVPWEERVTVSCKRHKEVFTGTRMEAALWLRRHRAIFHQGEKGSRKLPPGQGINVFITVREAEPGEFFLWTCQEGGLGIVKKGLSSYKGRVTAYKHMRRVHGWPRERRLQTAMPSPELISLTKQVNIAKKWDTSQKGSRHEFVRFTIPTWGSIARGGPAGGPLARGSLIF